MEMIPFIKRRIFWFNDFLHGMPMWREFKDVCAMMKDSVAFESVRQERLAGMLSYAKKNTRFYSSVESNELCDFPVVNKHVILSDYDAFLVPVERIPGQKGPLRINITSGSTGTPFRSKQDTRSRVRRIATLKAANELVGFHSCMPMMYLRSSEMTSDVGMFNYDARSNIWLATIPSFDDESLGKIADLIIRKKIRFIRGYLSLIEYLTEYVDRKGIVLPSKPTFITIGEKLKEPLRSRIVDRMGLHIISQYSNEENGVFGQSELDGSGELIRLNKANCIIELLGLDNDEPVPMGQPGRVVVTDLTNKAMPMIRYDIGDLAICRETLPSGEPLVIQLLECRKEDMVYDTSGHPVPMVLPYEIWCIPFLRQLQFVQEDVNKYVLIINVSSGKNKLDKSRLADIMKDVFGADADVEVQLVDDIPVISAGKRKFVIQKCEKYIKWEKNYIYWE